jgi:hypothetical protein
MPSNGAAMRRVFEIGVYVLLAAVLVQFFLAGLGVFGSAELFFWHTTVNALVIFVLCIALVIVGWLAHEDGLTVGMPGIIVGLVILQSLLLFPYHMAAPVAVRAISALHVVNGLVIFWLALRLMDRVRHPKVARP